MTVKRTVNTKVLEALPGIESFADLYLEKIIEGLGQASCRKYLQYSIKGHTAGSDKDALAIARQEGTWDDYSDLELAKLDLALNFNSWYYRQDDVIFEEDIIEYCMDGGIEDFEQ